MQKQDIAYNVIIIAIHATALMQINAHHVIICNKMIKIILIFLVKQVLVSRNAIDMMGEVTLKIIYQDNVNFVILVALHAN